MSNVLLHSLTVSVESGGTQSTAAVGLASWVAHSK